MATAPGSVPAWSGLDALLAGDAPRSADARRGDDRAQEDGVTPVEGRSSGAVHNGLVIIKPPVDQPVKPVVGTDVPGHAVALPPWSVFPTHLAVHLGGEPPLAAEGQIPVPKGGAYEVPELRGPDQAGTIAARPQAPVGWVPAPSLSFVAAPSWDPAEFGPEPNDPRVFPRPESSSFAEASLPSSVPAGFGPMSSGPGGTGLPGYQPAFVSPAATTPVPPTGGFAESAVTPSSGQASGPVVDFSRTNELLQQLLDEVRRGRHTFLPLNDRNITDSMF
jgi:hypothetical protein